MPEPTMMSTGTYILVSLPTTLHKPWNFPLEDQICSKSQYPKYNFLISSFGKFGMDKDSWKNKTGSFYTHFADNFDIWFLDLCSTLHCVTLIVFEIRKQIFKLPVYLKDFEETMDYLLWIVTSYFFTNQVKRRTLLSFQNLHQL